MLCAWLRSHVLRMLDLKIRRQRWGASSLDEQPRTQTTIRQSRESDAAGNSGKQQTEAAQDAQRQKQRRLAALQAAWRGEAQTQKQELAAAKEDTAGDQISR